MTIFSQKTKKGLSRIVFKALVIFYLIVCTQNAHAGIIISQVNGSYSETNDSVDTYVQTLGSGLSGTVKTIVIMTELVDYRIVGSGFEIGLARYANSDYTSFEASCSIELYVPDYTTEEFHTFNIGNFDTTCGSFANLQSDKYYALVVRADDTPTHLFYWRGTIDNLYQNGQAYMWTNGNPDLTTTPTDIVSDFNFLISTEIFNTGETRIISTVPYDGETISADANYLMQVLGYISSSDYFNGDYLRIKYRREYLSLANLFNHDTDGYFAFPFINYGYFSESTTTSLLEKGRYVFEVSICKNDWTNCLFPVVTQTGYFVVDELTAWDKASLANKARLALLGQADGGNGFSNCDGLFTNFSIASTTDCLFKPDASDAQTLVNAYSEAVFSKVPFGYITRFVQIINSPATTTLPIISYTFSDSFPIDWLAGQNFSFDVWTPLSQTSTLFQSWVSDVDGDNKNAWQIFETPITFIVYLALILMIINDLTNISPQGQFGEKGSLSDTGKEDDSYKLKEWLYNHKRK